MHESTSLLRTFRPLAYVGSPAERTAVWAGRAHYNLIVTSYEVVRSDIDRLCKSNFLYCVLDEGHIIRNTTAKVTTAVKSIVADHRLVLSGTPLQNEVVELWSLFDFLSPGYLGTERDFRSSYRYICEVLLDLVLIFSRAFELPLSLSVPLSLDAANPSWPRVMLKQSLLCASAARWH